MSIQQEIRESANKIIAEKGIKIKTLSKKTGISRTQISQFLNGKVGMGDSGLTALARALGLKLSITCENGNSLLYQRLILFERSIQQQLNMLISEASQQMQRSYKNEVPEDVMSWDLPPT